MHIYIYTHHYTDIKKVKVKWSRYRPDVAQRVGRGIALLFHDRGARRGWVVSSAPRPHFTPGKDPIPIVQEAGWAPGPLWTGAENLIPTGIRSQTFQPIVSRYTDWATGPTSLYWYIVVYRRNMLHYIILLLYNGMVSVKNKMCILISSAPLVWYIIYFKKKWARYDQKCVLVFAQCVLVRY